MVLRANSNAAAAPAESETKKVTPVGAFEPMDEETTSTVAANDAPDVGAEPEAPAPAAPAVAPAAAAPAASPAPAPTAPAPATSRAVTTTSKGEASAFQKEVEAMKGAADFSYGNYPVYKGNNGEIVNINDNKDSLGRWVKVSMIAWDDHYEVSPGSQSEKSKEAVAYTKDGVTIDSVIGKERFGGWVGKNAMDYVNFLRDEEDFSEAGIRRFIDVACVVHEYESGADIAGEIIQITLSESSIPSFSAYQEKLKAKAKAVARGIPGVVVPEDPFTFYFLRELAEKGSNKWTKLKVLDKLPAKL